MRSGRIVSQYYVAFFVCLLLVTTNPVAPQQSSRKDQLQYYRQEFEAGYKYPIYDTLFEKIVWERKVSHLVMEFQSNEYRVTLLMMDSYPYNYKAQTYPVFFAYSSFADAAKKFELMNHFLRNNGVMAVGLDGKRIVKERVLVAPVGNVPPRPQLTDWSGGKDTDPILTREILPRLLPLKISR